MNKNMGKTDRLMRLILAILLLAYAYWKGSWIALGFSLFTFYEAWAGWCAFYHLLGKSSCPLAKNK